MKELIHYGVKGMKWGVRKSDGPSRTSGSKSSKSTDTDPQSTSKKKIARTVAKGGKAAAKVLSKVGKAYVTDQILFGGAGTEITKATITTIGRASITAYTMARGGHDIKWYDKNGRRVG